ncbi:MAG TPA: NAD(P)/FAD-dependent oxidoreductase [Candidatus Omnitrophota bacterium]|nr:NAD(P)/FAD-dependent oxidoreductase [Candidatus Omnitrophota bacterium]
MIWPVCVVGAGAAGLMTAITAARTLNAQIAEGSAVARSAERILLLDTREKYGAKIIMSGGTRCNLTNRSTTEKDYATNEPNIVRAILRGYTSEQALKFFNEIGVETAEEPGIGKFFPVQNSGQFVLEMLIKEAIRLGVTIETPRKVTEVEPANGAFKVSGEGFEYTAQKVVLTTGGLSFPSTGSDGTGDTIVQKLGHTILFREPSLTPLTTADEDWKKLTGISLDVKMTFLENNKSVKSFQGSFLFTHFGFSGPVVLNISRFWICSKAEKKQMLVSFLPNHTEEQIRKEIVQGHFLFPKQTIKNYLSQKKLPDRFVETLLQKCCINRAVPLCDLIKNERETLIKELFRHELSVTGDKGYAKAEVTAGGVDLREIRKDTMESRKVPGLYLAGEILDCDGKIGGFNFQWAWSTGYLAGKAAAAR